MLPCAPLHVKMAESSEEEENSLNLTGFLFGNINEKGELEDTEVLDEVRVIGLLKECSWPWYCSRCTVSLTQEVANLRS